MTYIYIDVYIFLTSTHAHMHRTSPARWFTMSSCSPWTAAYKCLSRPVSPAKRGGINHQHWDFPRFYDPKWVGWCMLMLKLWPFIRFLHIDHLRDDSVPSWFQFFVFQDTNRWSGTPICSWLMLRKSLISTPFHVAYCICLDVRMYVYIYIYKVVNISWLYNHILNFISHTNIAHTYICIYTYIHIQTHTHIYMYIYIYIYICICICTYIYIYIYVYE